MPTATKKKAPPAKPTAAICDDDPMSRQLMTTILEQTGFEVISRVDNAVGAIQIASMSQPDVLLLDLVLPNMSGEDAIPAIKAAAPDCMIIVCSAHNASSAVKAGASLVVPKGSHAELQAVLTSVMARIQKQAGRS